MPCSHTQSIGSKSVESITRAGRSTIGEQVTFAELAQTPAPRIEDLALAMAGEVGEVDAAGARAELDRLGAALTAAPVDGAEALTTVLGEQEGFAGDREHYDHPDNSMLDVVLRRRLGLPILLSVVYIAAGERAGIAVDGVGLPGHFVVGVGPVLLDPFNGGVPVEADVPTAARRPWPATDIAMRMLNNLVGTYQRRGNLALALTVAELRLVLPASPDLRDTLEGELRALRARLN
jgi:regulator of sirC expression with transglutaminase-like and TPR domain